LLSTAIVEEFELIWVCCGWRTPVCTYSVCVWMSSCFLPPWTLQSLLILMWLIEWKGVWLLFGTSWRSCHHALYRKYICDHFVNILNSKCCFCWLTAVCWAVDTWTVTNKSWYRGHREQHCSGLACSMLLTEISKLLNWVVMWACNTLSGRCLTL
jgi:hypothetical protein